MFSKLQALKLIKMAMYHNVMFLAYSVIHPRFTTTNFYYIPLVLFIINIFVCSSRNILNRAKSEGYEQIISPIYSIFLLFSGFCFLIYCFSDIFMSKGSIKDLRIFIDIAVCVTTVYIISFYTKDFDEPDYDSATTTKGSLDRNYFNFKHLIVLSVLGVIELIILLAYMQPQVRYFILQCVPIPIFMLALRLLTYDFIVLEKLKGSYYLVVLIVLAQSSYALISFGLTSFLLFSKVHSLFNTNLMLMTVLLYSFTEIIIRLFKETLRTRETTEKSYKFEQAAVDEYSDKTALIKKLPVRIIECVNCNFSIKNPSTNLCPNCGSDIYTKSDYISCESCGSEYDNSAKSCPYCGHIPAL